MASSYYNRGKQLIASGTLGATLHMVLVTSAYTPDPDHNTWSEASANEITAGNGYLANGKSLATPAFVEDDANDRSEATVPTQLWTAAGGDIPSAGSGARYALVMKDHATPGSREMVAWYDLGGDKVSSVSITLSGFKLRLT